MKTKTSLKVKKTTVKRGRPVSSTKVKKLENINSKITKNTHELLALWPAKEYLENHPDSQATAQQVKDWSRFKPQGETEEEINYWKYACVAILLGLVAGMIIATPTIINLVEVCSQ